jgi:hypothetical protein
MGKRGKRIIGSSIGGFIFWVFAVRTTYELLATGFATS